MGGVTAVTRRVSRRDVFLAATALNVELAAVVAYLLFTDVQFTSPWFLVSGLVWVNLGLFVGWRYEPPAVDRRTRLRVGGLVAVYAAVLAVAGGLVGVTNPATPSGLSVSLLPPGWGPALVYGGGSWSAAIMPARVAGYGAVVYLTYGRLASASSAGVAGLLGLFSCVSCTFPVVAGTVGALVGGGSFAASLAADLGYGVSTGVLLLTVLLLWVGPSLPAVVRQFGER